MFNFKIISKIHIIDYYANKKYQFLFNTKNHIYILDRNGNFIENYPVKLPAKATCGISVFDYNDNCNYRIFVACNDKQVYLYQKDGQINKDWKITQTKDYVKTPIQYFSYENKDYIVFADNLNIYILNRKGEVRINPKTNYQKEFEYDISSLNKGIYFIKFESKEKEYRKKFLKQ